MKAALFLASAVLAAGTLAACGGGDDGPDSDYCKDLKSAQNDVKSATSGDARSLENGFKAIHKLAKESPDKIEKDWKTVDDGITAFERALKEAGFKPSDFAELAKGKLPKGVNAGKLQKLTKEISKLSADEYSKASTAIQKHAKDVCKVTI